MEPSPLKKSAAKDATSAWWPARATFSLQPKEVNDRGYHFAYPLNEEACIGCAACALVCPDACIEVYKVVVK